MADLLVNIDVDRLDAAIAFYTAVFELHVGRRFGDAGVELLGASSAIYLLAKADGSRANAASQQLRDYRRHWTPIHLDFVVTNLDQAVERAVAAGAVLDGPAERHAWGRIAHLSDPFGHGFCLLQFLGRGYDDIAD